MKRLFHYILILLTTLLIRNLCFADSNKGEFVFSSAEPEFENTLSSTFEFKLDSEVKQFFFIQKNFKDKIELSESESETEDCQTNNISGTFNFFETYLYTASHGNFSNQIQNGLTPCKHHLYLATIKSFCIIFCVYRI